MSADARMIGTDGNVLRIIDLEKTWLRFMEDAGFKPRKADVGEPILTEVMILSAVEASRINDAYRNAANTEMQRFEADPNRHEFLRHLFSSRVECAERVSHLITAVGRVSYFSPWIIVETAD